MRKITKAEINRISIHKPKASDMKLLSMYWLQQNEEWKAKQYYKFYRQVGGKLTFSDFKRKARID